MTTHPLNFEPGTCIAGACCLVDELARGLDRWVAWRARGEDGAEDWVVVLLGEDDAARCLQRWTSGARAWTATPLHSEAFGPPGRGVVAFAFRGLRRRPSSLVELRASNDSLVAIGTEHEAGPDFDVWTLAWLDHGASPGAHPGTTGSLRTIPVPQADEPAGQETELIEKARLARAAEDARRAASRALVAPESARSAARRGREHASRRTLVEYGVLGGLLVVAAVSFVDWNPVRSETQSFSTQAEIARRLAAAEPRKEEPIGPAYGASKRLAMPERPRPGSALRERGDRQVRIARHADLNRPIPVPIEPTEEELLPNEPRYQFAYDGDTLAEVRYYANAHEREWTLELIVGKELVRWTRTDDASRTSTRTWDLARNSYTDSTEPCDSIRYTLNAQGSLAEEQCLGKSGPERFQDGSGIRSWVYTLASRTVELALFNFDHAPVEGREGWQRRREAWSTSEAGERTQNVTWFVADGSRTENLEVAASDFSASWQAEGTERTWRNETGAIVRRQREAWGPDGFIRSMVLEGWAPAEIRTIQYTTDERGQIASETYVDGAGATTPWPGGVAIRTFRRDGTNRVVRECAFEPSGRQAEDPNWGGAHCIDFTYEADGLSQVRLWGADGLAVEGALLDFHGVDYERSAAGFVATARAIGVDDEPGRFQSGPAVYRYSRDLTGRIEEVSFATADGKPALFYGAASTVSIREDDGTTRRCLFKEKRPVVMQSGPAADAHCTLSFRVDGDLVVAFTDVEHDRIRARFRLRRGEQVGAALDARTLTFPSWLTDPGERPFFDSSTFCELRGACIAPAGFGRQLTPVPLSPVRGRPAQWMPEL